MVRDIINETILYSGIVKTPKTAKLLIQNNLPNELYLFTDMGIDSLGLMDIIFVLEAKFKIKIKNKKIAKVRTLEDLYRIFEDENIEER